MLKGKYFYYIWISWKNSKEIYILFYFIFIEKWWEKLRESGLFIN